MSEEIILIRSNILELINFDAIVCPSNLKLKSDGLLGRKTLNSRIHDIGGKQLDFDRLITKKLVLGVVVKIMLQKNSRWLMKLMNRLGINISDEVLNAVIRDNIKDIRMKARDDRSIIYVDLRNVSVTDVYDRLHLHISTSPYFNGFDPGDAAQSDEDKRKAVDSAVKFINDEKVIQKIIDDIVSTEEKTSKAAELLKNLRITAGEIRYR